MHCLDQVVSPIKFIIFLCFEALCVDNLKEKEILNGSNDFFLIPFLCVRTVTHTKNAKIYSIKTIK